MPPMHEQYIDFIKNYSEKVIEEKRKQLEENIVRKRIDGAIPSHLKKSTKSFKQQRSALGYMSDKHTYCSMRKVASHKTRKLYIFDSFATKQK